MKVFIIIALSILVGVGRFFVPGHDVSLPGSYEAAAHIWVGILIGLLFTKYKGLAATAAIILTTLEGIAFAVFKGWL